MKILNYLVSAFIMLIRPLLGPASCKFPISCGNFALEELKEKPFLQAFYSVGKQVLLCSPFSRLIKK